MTEAARLEGVIALVGLEKAQGGLKGFSRQIDTTQTGLDGLGTSSLGAGRNVESLGKRLDAAGQRMSVIGGSMSRRLTVPLLGLGLAAGKVGTDFDTQMSKVAAKSGATGRDLDRLRAQALKLGQETSFSAREAAQGMEELAAAGLKPRQVLAAMPGLLDAAAASGEGVAAVSGIVANALAQFNLEASDSTRIADVLAKASNETQGSITSMGEALKYAGTGARTLGFDLEETTGMLSMMVKAGIDGSQAGTSLRMAMQRLAVVPPIRSLEKLGDISPKLEAVWKSATPVPEKLRAMSVEFAKMDGTSRTAAAGLIFGTEASTGMLQVLSGGPAAMDRWTASMRTAGGSAKEMGRVMRDDLGGDIEQLGGALESAFIGVFDQASGPLRNLAQNLTGLVTAFSGLPAGVQQSVVAIGALVAVAGPALMLFGSMATGMVAVGGAVTMLGAGIGTLAMAAGTAVPALASLSLVIAANPLLTGAIVVGGIVAASAAMLTMSHSSDSLGVSAEDAARAVRELDAASDQLAGNNISQKEADLGLVMARKQASAAAQTAAIANDKYGKSSQQAKDAALASAQADLQVERAVNTAREARAKNVETISKATRETRANIATIKAETAEQERLRAKMLELGDAVETGGRGGLAAKRSFEALSKQLKESEKKAADARAALERAGVSAASMGTAAQGAGGKVANLNATLGKVPKNTNASVNVKVFGGDALQHVSNLIDSVDRRVRAAAGGGGGRTQRNAKGGIIKGEGTGTSDSILSWVSNGEAVIPESSTRANRGLVEWLIDNPGEKALPGYAKGKKPKRMTRAGAQAALGRLNASTSLSVANADKQVAAAEGTVGNTQDDLAALQVLANRHAAEERNLVRFAGSRAYRLLPMGEKASVQQQIASARRSKQSALDRRQQILDARKAATDEASDRSASDAYAAEDLRREALGLESQSEEKRRLALNAIRRANGLPELGPQGAGGLDAQAPDLAAQLAQAQQRASIAEGNLRLSEDAVRAFGSPGDIGFGRGRNAYQSAAPTIIVNSLTGYSPEIQQTVSDAAGGGFAAGGNSYRLYSGRG